MGKREREAAGKRPASLAGKINRIIAVILAIGLGATAFVFAWSLVEARRETTRRSLEDQADFLYAAIENFMLPGEAPIAVAFFEDVRLLSPDYRVELYRADGRSAFSDGTTIDAVNARLGRVRFAPRDGMPDVVVPPDQTRFAAATAVPPSDVFFTEVTGGRSFYRIYRPLVNLPKCTGCHGADHTIRGVIDLRADVTELALLQSLTVAGTGGGFVLLVLLLALLIGRFMRTVVVRPVREIGALCRQVTDGRFDGQVVPRSSDEIGALAATVNGMVKGLRERAQLAKYVSSGTIDSLGADGERAERDERTLLFTDVRGFTAYTERTEPERVVEVLNRLLERQSAIVHAHGGDVDKFVGDEVVAVFSGEDAARRALEAAAEIRREVEDGRGNGAYDGLRVGAGLATGKVIHGMIGSE
ncbi:MAG TPA: adenylate/guanylate cyclase domain-containing protein, partial [Spirochaetales bacterium]|nr:adenylate/guanylate cyclase domain-containing protein [Spirochaetales bacterium]